MKIIIHRFENEKWGRCHLPFFKRLDNYLSNFFDLEIINYNKDGNTFSGNINLINNTGQFGKNPPLSDVEYLIENSITGDVKLISFTEYFNSYVSHIVKSKYTTNVLLSHFNWDSHYYWLKRENALDCLHKIKPFIFLPFKEFNVDFYRKKRLETLEFNNKLFWMGSGIDSYRKTIKHLNETGYLQDITPVDHETYLDRLTKSKIGLSFYMDLDKYISPFDYPGEFCYRDMEYMLCGLPFIRIEYKDSLYDPLLPNHHYISIPREKAYKTYENYGDDGVKEEILKVYHNVLNDNDFLKYMSKNQIEWSNKNLMNDNDLKLAFQLLNIKDWL